MPEVCHGHRFGSAKVNQWRSNFGGMDAPMMKQLKELEKDNKRLKKMYAEDKFKSDIRAEALKRL